MGGRTSSVRLTFDMSEYLSPADLLSDVRLRLDSFEQRRLGILIVEGPDDRRVFFRHVESLALIVPAGGRTMLLRAYNETTVSDRKRILFLTDCDYEVRRGSLRARDGLIITEKTDVECDLIDLGALYAVVGELVPEALGSDERLYQIADRILAEATAFALPLGRMRMAAQPMGVPLNLETIKHRRYWNYRMRSVNLETLNRAIYSRVREEINMSIEEWNKRVQETPDDVDMCHGKDLLGGIFFALKKNHNIDDDVEVKTISRLLRTGVRKSELRNWSVIRRIREWEHANKRKLLNDEWSEQDLLR